MKTELKGWLADNTVTTDNKEDKILVLESAGNLTLSDVLDEMKKEDTACGRDFKACRRSFSAYSIGIGTERILCQYGAFSCRTTVSRCYRRWSMES